MTDDIVQTLKYCRFSNPIAVAVSGGPDSMALVFALSVAYPDHDIHALSVDHGLREEASEELSHVSKTLRRGLNITHHILKWDNEKPETKIMEEARNARYALMADRCEELNIHDLCVGHHSDDQAETILFRLAKGSGIDGLSGMAQSVPYSNDLNILRPLLNAPKGDLIAYCENNGIEYVSDPSNHNDTYSRVRLRNSMSVLEKEGLSAKRLNTLGLRAERYKTALNWSAENAFIMCAKQENGTIILNKITEYPFEIVLRIITKAIDTLVPQSGYPVRLDRLEALVFDVFNEADFRKRTFAKVIFEKDKASNALCLSLEKP